MAASRLRITGGTARGLPIVEPRGHRLRPTSGLVREALFNILGKNVAGATVLDLFAGTGALGLEALSRGASHVIFIEAAPAACQAILLSLARAGFADAGTVVRGRLPAALPQDHRRFDLVFLDPPYGDETAGPTLLASASLLAGGGTIVYEHGSRYNPPARPTGLQLTDRRLYGDTALAFYAHEEGE